MQGLRCGSISGPSVSIISALCDDPSISEIRTTGEVTSRNNYFIRSLLSAMGESLEL